MQAARKFIADLSFDFALIDVNLPDGRATELLQEKAFSASTGVIVMTADGGVAGAVEAMRLGALDYLVKPFDPAELPLVIGRASRTKRTARIEEHRRSSGPEFFFGAHLAPVKAHLEKILAADNRMQTALAPVLIQGETGTGKTTIARWLHANGPRSAQPLVEVNCSAMPDTLAESELFGHERGAFTDARTARIGLFEAANGGSLFLDELPSLSSALQAKVLTALEDGKIRRLGGNKAIPVDVRVIAATNRDLKHLITEGTFREDLFHRLDLFRLVIPPLRERGQDILELADSLMKGLCQRYRATPKEITPLGRQRILGFPWPGNVRELAHELERAIVFEEGDALDFASLQSGNSPVPPAAAGAGGAMPATEWFNTQFHFPAEGFSLEEAILRLIHHALAQTGQNISAAARLLGVSRDYLRYRLSGQKEQGKTADGTETNAE